MTPIQMTNPAQQRARWRDDTAPFQAELDQMPFEERPRVHASRGTENKHLFTLTFAHGEVALLDVRGAVDQEQARAIACDAIKRCQYSVTDGDQTGGNAHYFYSWCSVEVQAHAAHRCEEV